MLNVMSIIMECTVLPALKTTPDHENKVFFFRLTLSHTLCMQTLSTCFENVYFEHVL